MDAAALVAFSGGIFVTCTLGLFAVVRGQSMQKRQLSARMRRDVLPKGDLLIPEKRISLKGGKYSTLPILRKLLSRSTFTNQIVFFLEQAGSRMNVGSFLMLLFACFCTGTFLALNHWGQWSPLAGLALMAVPWMRMAIKRRKRLMRISEQLPDAIRLMTSALRAGLGLNAGLDIVANELGDPIQTEFRKLLNEWRLYSDVNEAFARFSRRIPTPDARLFATSARLHREVGGNFAELLDQLELTIRTRFELQRELKTMTAEGKFSGWVLGFLPIVVGLGLLLLNPSYFEILIHHKAGTYALGAAVALQLAGFFFIYLLTHPKIR